MTGQIVLSERCPQSKSRMETEAFANGGLMRAQKYTIPPNTKEPQQNPKSPPKPSPNSAKCITKIPQTNGDPAFPPTRERRNEAKRKQRAFPQQVGMVAVGESASATRSEARRREGGRGGSPEDGVSGSPAAAAMAAHAPTACCGVFWVAERDTNTGLVRPVMCRVRDRSARVGWRDTKC